MNKGRSPWRTPACTQESLDDEPQYQPDHRRYQPDLTTMVMIKLNAPRTLLTSSQLKGRDTPKDTPARNKSYSSSAGCFGT